MRNLGRPVEVDQLLTITKNCRRWSGIESLPPAIREAMQQLDALSGAIPPQGATRKGLARMLAAIEKACNSLKGEFSKAQIAFVCTSCPLRNKQ